MNSKTRVIILFLLANSSIANAQLDSLAMLGSLANGIESTSPETRGTTNSDPTEGPNNNIEKERQNLTDDQYGYTGGKNFKNPPKTKFSDEALEYFGYSYFVDQPSTFAPKNNTPIPPDYLIAPDDNIKIILFGNTNKKYNLKVTRDGDIFLPEIGPLYVAGISFLDLKDLIKTTINNQLIGTKVSVTLGALRSIDIFILGAANNPGMFSISALSTLTNAIIQSGGIDVAGSLRDIKLKRNGRIITSFDFYELLLNGDTSNDQRLMQGDVVFIETIGKTAAVNGEINRPGIYELKDSENLSELIRYAGNVKPKANLLTAEIKRINSTTNAFDLISVNLNNQSNQNLKVSNGDTVSIYPVPDNLNNAVLIVGHSQQPGFYPWKSGMRMYDLFDSPNDLLEMTDLNYVLIKRKETKAQNFRFLQVDLEKLFSNPESEENILLSDQDEIILFPSLLSSDLITTKMIQDKYVIDEETNKMILENQWTSLTYLRKSLMEEVLTVEEQNAFIGNENQYGAAKIENNPNENIMRFYEYSIYEYCIIPTDFASRILISKGLTKTETIPIRDLNKVTTPLQLESLINSLEFEEEKEIPESSDEINIQLTNICRRQLIDPIISIAKSQSNPSERTKIVKSFGNLLFPGEYPYSKNMDLEDLIYASGGLKDADYLPQIEINSRKMRNKEYIISSRNMVFSNNQNTKELIDPMDEINVKEVSNKFRSVEISGEVNYPGFYPIIEGESLNDLIRRAGGIKESGSYEGAIFTRESLRESDRKRLKEAQTDLRRKILLSVSQQTQTNQQGGDGLSGVSELVKLLTFEQEDNELLGRLVIDLESMLMGRSPEIDLEDKDKIFIPRKQQMVTVVGEVNGSNSHQYKQSLGISDYISLSGGFSSFGDTDNIYIVKSDGSTFSYSNLTDGFFRGSSQIQAGDTIVIPFQAEKFGQLRAASEVTQIIYQMAIAAAAVNSF